MTTAADSSGNGRTGTYQNSTAGAYGLVVGDADTAARFAHVTDDYVIADAVIPAQAFTGLTLGCIMKPSNVAQAVNFISLYDNSTGGFGFALNAGVLSFDASDGVTPGAVAAVTTLANGFAYRVIGIWDGAHIQIYVNGILEASVAFSTAVSTAADRKFMVGELQSEIGGFAGYDGVFDEVFFKKAAITPTQIATIDAAMTGTGSVATAINAVSPYLYWRLGELAPTPASILSIDYSSATTLGGQRVTITGTGMAFASQATFGGILGTNFSLLDSTHCAVTTPPTPPGTQTVVVT